MAWLDAFNRVLSTEDTTTSAMDDSKETHVDDTSTTDTLDTTSTTDVEIPDDGTDGSEVTVEKANDTEVPNVADETEVTEVTKPTKEPVAVLKVYGQEIPVYSKDELIALAQKGVDYNAKMYTLKSWKTHINVLSKNSLLRDLVERAANGSEDEVRKIIERGMASTDAVPTDDTEDVTDEFSYDTGVKKVFDNSVKQAVTPISKDVESMQRELFLLKLRTADPTYFDSVYNVMGELYNTPNALPKQLANAINNDPETFVSFYKAIRQELINRNSKHVEKEPAGDTSETVQTKPDAEPTVKTKTVEKPVQRFTKTPVLERATSDTVDIESQVRDEAEKIWNMSDKEFREYESRIRKR